jgi:predicted O-methyltransferase YrrM
MSEQETGRIAAPGRALVTALKAGLARWLRDRRFSASLRSFRRRPERWRNADDRVLDALFESWGNPGWSAKRSYLKACVAQVQRSQGPILECGSGLSTILIGSVAEYTGQRVWSLEHSSEWAARTRAALARYGIRSVTLAETPLRPYDGYSWYDVSACRLPPRFATVICDGPPGDTPGGRFGLVPVLGERLGPGTVILLDDAERHEERAIARRWLEALSADAELHGEDNQYLRIVLTA